MIVYLESSAGVKLIRREPESLELQRFLHGLEDRDEIIGAALVETEIRRAGIRWGVDQAVVAKALAGISLLAMPRELFSAAGLLPMPDLRSLDALHVAAALRAAVDLLITYDRRILAAAYAVGLPTLSPA